MTGDAQTGAEVVPFGKYLLDAEIARGGMARVFRARLRGLGGFEKKLVVKQILPQLATDPRFVELFVREANVLVAMSHPGIVPVYELGIVDGVYFLAMEHVDGATLAELVAARGALPPAQVAQLGAQIADALHYAHDKFGLVHRDVTPRNVIVDTTGNARLLDFGIAAPAEGTATTEIFGSHGYMSPEQLRGETLTPASDVFSLGATLFEALSGAPAFFRKDALASREALDGPTPPLPDGVPDELARVVIASLSRDAKERPQSAAEVGKRLRGFLAGARPEGVSEELAARVETVLASRGAATEGPATASFATPSKSKGEPSGVVRTLATSRALDELALGTTELQRRAAEEKARATPAPAEAATPGTVRVERASRPRTSSALTWLLPMLVATIVVAAFAYTAFGGGSGETDVADAGPRAVLVADAGVDAGAVAEPDAGPEPDAGSVADAGAEPDAGAARDAGAVATGYVTINALPWANLRLDHRGVGRSPLRNYELRAGSHTLDFDCPPLGRHAHVPIRVTAGATTSVVVDLNRDPPEIRIE